MPLSDTQKANLARYRAKQKALGIKPKPLTDVQKAIRAAKIAAKRAAAKASGEILPGDNWAAMNPEKHKARVARWRGKNPEKTLEIYRNNQATRRSTPWGQINNSLCTCMHQGVRRKSTTLGLYNQVLGYSWAELHAHFESQFLPGMTWENWGEVWEVDHIKPLSSFQFTSVADPLFRECWALSNLRPLWRDANAKKSAKGVEGASLHIT